MAQRQLSPDEAEIWAKVTASVRRMAGRADLLTQPAPQPSPPGKPGSAIPVGSKDTGRRRETSAPAPAGAARVGETLDGGWDRRLQRGVIVPDRSIDLHGHTLSSAHHLLDQALDRAAIDGSRVLLVITGKPPRDPAPHRRGLIRAAIGDWLGASRHAGQIAAVRNAHPRHGGAGALYVILRRARNG
jgi:DNA-nicking Smr family endonuclease